MQIFMTLKILKISLFYGYDKRKDMICEAALFLARFGDSIKHKVGQVC
jgi:hypothetical protein